MNQDNPIEHAIREQDIAIALSLGWVGPVVWYDGLIDPETGEDFSGPYAFPPSSIAIHPDLVAANDRGWDALIPSFSEVTRRAVAKEYQ